MANRASLDASLAKPSDQVDACIGESPVMRFDDAIVDLFNRMNDRIGETPVTRSSWSRRLVIGGLLASNFRGLVAYWPLAGQCAPLPYGKCFMDLVSGPRLGDSLARS